VKNRFVPAVAIALILGLGAGIGHAQLVVFDPLAFAQHLIISGLQDDMNSTRQSQAEKVYKMSLRLAQWTSMNRFDINRDLMPEWRIHNWFTDDVLYARPYNFALTYGDSIGDGYDRVTIPRHDAVRIFAWLDPSAAATMRTQLALIDLADSAIIRGTHETGRLRFNGRNEAESIIAMQADVLKEDNEESLTAVLDKLSGAALVEAQNKQARAQFQAAVLEQLLIDQLWDRDADAALMNMQLRLMQAAQDDEGARSIVDGAGDTIRNWRLP